MPDWSTEFDDLDEPHKRGQATEEILKAAFLVRGIPIAEPAYDNEPYDFLVNRDGGFERIQAKTAYPNKSGTVQFETVTTRSRKDGYERDGYRGRADYFAVYNPVLEEIYTVPVEEAARGKMEIRFEPPKNGQRDGINWHESYLLENRFSGQ